MNKPTYYTVLPAQVRYHKKLSASQKILYSEISTLSKKDGYCFASNAHLARLMDTSPRTIRRWLDSLKANNLIKMSYQIKDKVVEQRKIFMVPLEGGTKMSRGEDTGVQGGGGLDVQYNSTSINKRYSVTDKIILGEMI